MLHLGSKLVQWVERNIEKRYVRLGECALFPTHSPKLQYWDNCRCANIPRVGSSAAVHSKEADIRKRFGPPLPTHTFDWPQFWFIRFMLLPRRPQALSGLKACRGCRVFHFLCWPPHPLATGSPTEHTFPNPFPKSDFATSNHYARAAKFPWSGRIGASLGMYHFPAKGVQNAKWCQNGQWRTPRPHLAFFSHSLYS